MKTKYTTKSKNCIEKCKDFPRCKPCGEITKGKAFVVEYAGIFDIQSTNYYEETSLLDTDCHIEAEANAELFKEAFNVANETGLSPIQLNERIKELEKIKIPELSSSEDKMNEWAKKMKLDFTKPQDFVLGWRYCYDWIKTLIAEE